MIIMGAVVGVMFIAVYSPMLAIMTGLDGVDRDIPDIASATINAVRAIIGRGV